MFTLGKVLENYDKEHPGKIKVELKFCNTEGNKTMWLSVLSQYAGGKRGMYFLPEKDDAVLVGFLNDDFNSAVVLGSLWNTKKEPPTGCVNEENTLKKIVTKSGHQIAFDDKEKGSVTVKSNIGMQIVLDDDKESVTVSCKENKNKIVIDGKSGKIEITADKDINIKSSSANVKLEATNKVEIKGKQVEINADTSLTFGGKTVKLDGKSTQIESTSLTAKGSQVNVESTGILTLKGSLAKIN